MSRIHAVWISAALVSACAAGSSPSPAAGGSGGESSAAGLQTTSVGTGENTTTTGAGGAGGWQGLPWSSEPCSEPTKYVYAVSEEAWLYRYWPPTGQFTKVGALNCDGQQIAPFSMAIDKHAIAWVETFSADLYEVDLSNGHCTKNDYVRPTGENRFPHFGMAYSETPSTQEGETLFARGIFLTQDPPPDDPSARWLGAFDPATATIAPIGAAPGADSELTSSAGTLFALQVPTSTWASILSLDTTNGATVGSADVPGVQLPYDFAFAAWGGDFYIFSDLGEKSGTVVTRYRPSTGQSTPAPGGPLYARIVGAGVSTCAPTTPPS